MIFENRTILGCEVSDGRSEAPKRSAAICDALGEFFRIVVKWERFYFELNRNVPFSEALGKIDEIESAYSLLVKYKDCF